MSQPPLVSVVVTTFRRDDYLAQALASLAAQTVPLAEIVVVDDGGSGSAREVVAAHAPVARYVRQENSGQQAARNTGISHASGRWIAFLDDDDLWEADRHALLLRLIDTGEVDVIAGNFVKFDENGLAAEDYFSEHGRLRPGYWDGIARDPADPVAVVGAFPLARLLPDYPFWPSTLAVSRALLARAGSWDLSLRGVRTEDTEFAFRMLRAGRLGLIWKPSLRYRCHAGNHVHEGLKVALGRLRVWAHILDTAALTEAERAAILPRLRAMQSEALWGAYAEADYAAVLDLAGRIGWRDLSFAERGKVALAGLLNRLPHAHRAA